MMPRRIRASQRYLDTEHGSEEAQGCCVIGTRTIGTRIQQIDTDLFWMIGLLRPILPAGFAAENPPIETHPWLSRAGHPVLGVPRKSGRNPRAEGPCSYETEALAVNPG